ncbi:HAMP domain-containing sensor histidine kinase [Cellulomonas sp. Root485]|uniref:sensor histidine kinase n=1 Tax=Cellulomonas sp. Root485 TaxID=1736546 RepID=UPI000ABC0CEB|nr:HAMP domain-containing sensor histidine kinase [Cellulomonas sp. Root485]
MATTRLHTETAEAGHRADAHLWRAAVWGAVALWAAYMLVPSEHTVLRGLVLYPLADIASVVAVVSGVRRYRPRAPAAWLLIAGGLASFAVADFLLGILQLQGTQGFPSVADVFYLLAYPLFAGGLLVASRAGFREGRRGTFIDAGIITIAATLFALLLITSKYIADPDLSLAAAVVASAYPLADVLLLAVTAQFLLSTSWRPLALRLLTASLALILVGDVVYSVQELYTSAGDRRLADALLLAGVLTLGLAGLHPSMTALTARTSEVTLPRYSVRRVVSLYLISLVPVVVLAIQALTRRVDYVWITLLAMVAIAALVVTRFVDLVGQTLRAAEREAALSRFGSDLLFRTGHDELVTTAQRAVDDLVPGGTARVVETRPDPTDETGLFTALVVVNGHAVGSVVADQRETAEQGTRDALVTVARGLSLALERDSLLEAEQATADSLAEQNAQLRELDRMKDQLVSSVSHELRTPLTSIGGYAEMLLGQEFGDLNDDQQDFVEVIDRNARRLNRIIDDILFVARVDAGRLSLERSWVDVAEVAAASVEAALPRARQGGVSVELTAPDDLEPLWADQTRLTQMFDNLISNAVKFTPPGGTIGVTLSGAEDMVSAQIADTGIGIPPGEVDRLFERFFRASTVGAVDGTGLGLSIVKSIVEVHDGTIAVTSAEGVGTTITVELPVRQPAARPAETEAVE